MLKVVFTIALLIVPFINVIANEWKAKQVSDGFIYDFYFDGNNLFSFGENGFLQIFDLVNKEFQEFTDTAPLETYYNVFSCDNFLYYHAYNYNDRYSRIYRINKETDRKEVVIDVNYSIIATSFISSNEFLYSKYNSSSVTSNLLIYNLKTNKSDTLLSTNLSPINNQMKIIRSILGVSRDTIIVGSQEGKIAVTFNGGENWVLINLCNQDIIRIKFLNGKYWLFTGTSFEIFVSEDLLNWSRVLSEYSFTETPNACSLGDSIIYLVSNIRTGLSISNILLKSSDNGINWESEVIDNKYSFTSVSIMNNDCFIGTGNGHILYKENFLSVKENIHEKRKNAIFTYPNPANEFIEIIVNDNLNTCLDSKVRIYNIFGVLQSEYEIAYNRRIDVSKLNKGVYYVNYCRYYEKFIRD